MSGLRFFNRLQLTLACGRVYSQLYPIEGLLQSNFPKLIHNLADEDSGACKVL